MVASNEMQEVHFFVMLKLSYVLICQGWLYNEAWILQVADFVRR